MKKSTLIESTIKSNVKKNSGRTQTRPIVLTDEISKVTGFQKCVDCDNEELNGWSTHCKTCGMPIVY